MTPEYIQNNITADMINYLKDDVKLSFLKTHKRNLTQKQVQKIMIINEEISAILMLYQIDNLLEIQIQKILEFDILKINSIIQESNKEKDCTTILKMAKRYKDIPIDKFNEIIDFEVLDNVIEVFNESLIAQINVKNIQKINLVKLMPIISEELMLKSVNICGQMFTTEQIQLLDMKTIEIVSILIDKNIHKILSPKQICDINFEKINKEHLMILINDNSKDFSQMQLESTYVTEILPNLSNDEQLAFLKLHINDLTPKQINLFNVKYPKTAAVILINRPNDMSVEQIQQIDFTNNSQTEIEIQNIMSGCHSIDFIRKVNRYKDLTDIQLNNIPNVYNYINMKEIIMENLESKIVKKNIQKINIT